MKSKTRTSLIAVTGLVAMLAVAAPALADTTTAVNETTQTPGSMGMHAGWGRGGIRNKAPGIFGTVSAVNGSTLTVTSKMMRPRSTSATAAATTYTVDATNATVTKNGTAGTLASIVTGDTVVITGTVTGTNVVAKTIRDGVPQKGQKPGQNPIITGNGQPVIGGNVTAISGSTLTVTNKSNVTYTVDATKATIEKANATASLSSVLVGDNVVVQGTVNGNAIVASSVIDQGVTSSVSVTNTDDGASKGHGGFFGGIGNFFAHLFGF